MWYISLKYLDSCLKQEDLLNKQWSKKPKFVTEPELNQEYQYGDSLPRLAHNGASLRTTTSWWIFCPVVPIKSSFFCKDIQSSPFPSSLKDKAGFGCSFPTKWLSHKPRGELLPLPLSQQSASNSAGSTVTLGLANPYQRADKSFSSAPESQAIKRSHHSLVCVHLLFHTIQSEISV